MSYWQEQYNELQVQELLDSKYRNLSPEAKEALRPALLQEQQNKSDNPHRRSNRQNIHYNLEQYQVKQEDSGYGY